MANNLRFFDFPVNYVTIAPCQLRYFGAEIYADKGSNY